MCTQQSCWSACIDGLSDQTFLCTLDSFEWQILIRLTVVQADQSHGGIHVVSYVFSHLGIYLGYGKCPKISNTLFSTILAWIMLLMHLFLKILSGMANSVDPDQTAPSGAVWSGSALFAYVILSETLVFKFLGHLPYILYALSPLSVGWY